MILDALPAAEDHPELAAELGRLRRGVHMVRRHLKKVVREQVAEERLLAKDLYQIWDIVQRNLPQASESPPTVRADEASNPGHGLDHLTGRQRMVLELVAAGRANKEIATELEISPRTVANHLNVIYAKLGLRDRTQAALAAVANGIVAVASDAAV
jgi:DNA-binding NarL/FixJ family response regulator